MKTKNENNNTLLVVENLKSDFQFVTEALHSLNKKISKRMDYFERTLQGDLNDIKSIVRYQSVKLENIERDLKK